MELPPHELPASLNRLWVLETGDELSARELRTAATDRRAARSAALAASLPTRLDFVWVQAPTPEIRPGDWMVDIRNGHVRNPARVARVRPAGRDRIVWHAPLKVPRRPRISTLRALEPNLRKGGFQQLEVRGEKRTTAILDLFR